MAETLDTLLDKIVRVIVEEADPEQIILFGSLARCDVVESSDIDLIIVESEPFGKDRSRRAETARLYRALDFFDTPVDLLVYSSDEVEYWRGSLNHVLGRALREGRLLYERP